MDNYTCNGKNCNLKDGCKRYKEWTQAFREDREVEEFETPPFDMIPKESGKKVQTCRFKR